MSHICLGWYQVDKTPPAHHPLSNLLPAMRCEAEFEYVNLLLSQIAGSLNKEQF